MSGYDRAKRMGSTQAQRLLRERGVTDEREQAVYRTAFMAALDAANYLGQQQHADRVLKELSGKLAAYVGECWPTVHQYTREGLIEREEALAALRIPLSTIVSRATAEQLQIIERPSILRSEYTYRLGELKDAKYALQEIEEGKHVRFRGLEL